MTFGHKIVQLRRERGWSQYKLEVKSGVPRTTIASIEINRAIPKTDVLLKLARGFDIPVEELYEAAGYETGKRGERHIETPEEILERLKIAQPVSIPVYTEFRLHAGAAHEEPADYIYRERSKEAGRNIEAYIIHGRCMEPKISDGDIVVVDRDLPGEPGDTVLCLAKDELILGQLITRGDEVWVQNNEQSVKLEVCQASAVVIEAIKRFK